MDNQIYQVMLGYILTLIIAPIYSYLIGSLNASIILGLIFKKRDIREQESKNAGATNMLRVHGKKLGLLTMFLDILKPIITVSITFLIYKYQLRSPFDFSNGFNIAILVYFGGLFTILGHCFPIYFGFKGGKGVACYGGLLIVMNPFVALVGIIIILIILATKHYMSLASIVAASICAVLVLIPGINYSPYINEDINYFVYALNPSIRSTSYLLIYTIPSAGFIILKHKKNIERLILRTENKTYLSSKLKNKAEKAEQQIKN
ncbi:glycerol-3-phosphate 1-O-acyltransferase PlsY [Ureaplasma diversum]|uniref:glycerol-3-phosphate 1-O-acyltransferase PlsY n=1 Tax=Ureaplasma diversum TaxID=42094 RepID=UPI000B163A30|nr:glycerol-3-phosphate 1-O-acyltransferase PlsY [Ureaplasma diversum]